MHCFTWCFWFSVFASFWFLALQMMWFHSMLRSIKARNNHYSCTCHFKMSILHWRCPKSIWNCIQISRTQLVESSVVKFSFSEKATKICEKFSSWFCHLLSKCQNHEEDCTIFCGHLRKAEFQNTLFPIFMLLHEAWCFLWYLHFNFKYVRRTQIFAPKFKHR